MGIRMEHFACHDLRAGVTGYVDLMKGIAPGFNRASMAGYRRGSSKEGRLDMPGSFCVFGQDFLLYRKERI